GCRIDGERHRRRPGPGTDEREELEDRRCPEPETGAAPVAPKRRRKRDVPAAATREEVHGGEKERQKRGDQPELDRPAREDPRAEVDVASRSRRELHRGIEPAEELLGRAPELAEALRVEPADLVEERRRRAFAARGQRQRRQSMGE